MKLEVLVTTMHQKDISKYFDMNLQTDAVIANQSDFEVFEVYDINNSKAKFVTTSTSGLSKNRNIAISKIIEEFKNHPKADAIKFNINCISKRKIAMESIKEFHKPSRKEVTSWGVVGLVIKTDVLKEKSLKFNERFGAGVENFCGEDSIFLQEIFKKKVNLYASPKFIAEIDQTDSTWFEGHNEKFFTVGGMVLNEIYPLLSYVLVIRSAYKAAKRKTSDLSFWQILKCYYKGIIKNAKERKVI